MEPTRVEIPADFLRGEPAHRRLSGIVLKYSITHPLRVSGELDDASLRVLNNLLLSHLDQLGEPKRGEPGYESYEDTLVQSDPDGTRVLYIDQEPARGEWGFWWSDVAVLVLIAVEKPVGGIPTRHYLLVAWSKETSQWVPAPRASDDDEPQPGHTFAVLDASSQGMPEVTPRIHQVFDALTGGRA